MKKFWLLIFSLILLMSFGCHSGETQKHDSRSDDSEETEVDSRENEETSDDQPVWFPEIQSAWSQKPQGMSAPSYAPHRIAARAMKLYDLNNDGKLDADELTAFPGMLFSLRGPKSIDTNGDGVIDENEISARIQAWIDMKVALTCPLVKFVDRKGRVPYDIIGKRVILTPDPVHEKTLKATEPITINENGLCTPSTPGNMDNLSGMPYGFYTITIEGTSYKNLGVEIFDGAKDDDVDSFVIEVKSL